MYVYSYSYICRHSVYLKCTYPCLAFIYIDVCIYILTHERITYTRRHEKDLEDSRARARARRGKLRTEERRKEGNTLLMYMCI